MSDLDERDNWEPWRPHEEPEDDEMSALPDRIYDEPHGGGSRPTSYVCADCAWTGSGVGGFDHHRETGHAIRIRNCPPDWPNCSFPPAARVPQRSAK